MKLGVDKLYTMWYSYYSEKTKKEYIMNRINEVDFETASTEDVSYETIMAMLLWLAKYFKSKGFGNPFNYNRAFEFIQAHVLGYNLEPVGGGSDGRKPDSDETAEFKGTEYKGMNKKGTAELCHGVSYNGTSRYDTIEEQEKYCKEKVMRDRFHYWTLFDYENGKLVKTLKIPAATIWKILWPKWKKSFETGASNKDPRIGASVSINLLKKEKYEIIIH